MLIELSITWTVVLNVAGWLVIQLGLGWLFTRLPASWFTAGRPRGWEDCGRFYERVTFVKRWKDRLPDAAVWFTGGFAKRRLSGTTDDYLDRFALETWRGELCHWCAMGCAPLFFLWNPWWGDLIIVVYAVTANLPCIIVQRYNRARLLRRRTRSESQVAARAGAC